jgi:hypothetical protein
VLVDNNWITKITAAKLRREMENEPLSTGILEVMGGACGVCEENYIYPDERCCFQFNVGAQHRVQRNGILVAGTGEGVAMIC